MVVYHNHGQYYPVENDMCAITRLTLFQESGGWGDDGLDWGDVDDLDKLS